MTMKANAFTIDSLMSDPNCCLGSESAGFLGCDGFSSSGNVPNQSPASGLVDSRTDSGDWRQNTASPPDGGAEIKSMEGIVIG